MFLKAHVQTSQRFDCFRQPQITVIHFAVTPTKKRHMFNKTNTRIGTREPHTTLTCLPVTVIIYLIILSLFEFTIMSITWW